MLATDSDARILQDDGTPLDAIELILVVRHGKIIVDPGTEFVDKVLSAPLCERV